MQQTLGLAGCARSRFGLLGGRRTTGREQRGPIRRRTAPLRGTSLVYFFVSKASCRRSVDRSVPGAHGRGPDIWGVTVLASMMCGPCWPPNNTVNVLRTLHGSCGGPRSTLHAVVTTPLSIAHQSGGGRWPIGHESQARRNAGLAVASSQCRAAPKASAKAFTARRGVLSLVCC